MFDAGSGIVSSLQLKVASQSSLTYQRADGAVHHFVRQLEDVAWEFGAGEELSGLVAEVVAVVAEEVVGGRRVAGSDLPEEVLEHLPGDVGHAEVLHQDGRTVRRPAGLALLDAAAEVVLAAVDDHAGVPVTTTVRPCQRGIFVWRNSVKVINP